MIYLGPPVSRPRPHIFIPSVNKGPILGESFGGVMWVVPVEMEGGAVVPDRV